MSEDLFAGLSAAEGDKRAVSLCDQGHAIHISAKICNPPTLSLPSSPTPHKHRGGDNHELTEARLIAIVEVSGVLLEQCNPLFWAYHSKIETGITNSRTREHQATSVGSAETETKEQESNESLCQRMFKVYRSSRAEWKIWQEKCPEMTRYTRNMQDMSISAKQVTPHSPPQPVRHLDSSIA